MSCHSKIKDIENLNLEDQNQKIIQNINKIVRNPKNISKYVTIVKELLYFYNKEYKQDNYKKFKKLFDKKLNKLCKRNDIKVTKMHLVSTFKYMIQHKQIGEDYIFRTLISKVPTRSGSGVNSIAVLLSPNPNGQPFSCEWDCGMCPDQSIKNGASEDVARSYRTNEPAVLRGFKNNWDPYHQLIDRFVSLDKQGHFVDKLEIIIEGGTFTSYPKDYIETFFRDIYYASNVCYDVINNPNYEPRKRLSLKNEMNIAVYESKCKLIGICIETRPDTITDDNILFWRKLGVTRVQIGVQHTDDKILKKIKRGHNFECSVQGMLKLKNHGGFKVDIHLMPDLPGTTPEKDIEMFNKVFNTDILCPDGLKIYPCQVVDFTAIKKWYETGDYVPYAESDFDKFMEVMKYGTYNVPRYTRPARTVRDYDFKDDVLGGNPFSNLGQLVKDELIKEGKICQDIRNREVFRHPEYTYNDTCKIKVINYDDKQEYFIEMTSADEKVLFGFIRLRIPNKTIQNSPFAIFKNKIGYIRELHVYNRLIPVGHKNDKMTQHKGIGKLLIKKAEEIAWYKNCIGVSVISGEGVRLYYQKLGYNTIETYEVKYFDYTLSSIYESIYVLISLLIPIIFFMFYIKT